LWSKERGQNKEVRRLEKRTNKYKSVKTNGNEEQYKRDKRRR